MHSFYSYGNLPHLTLEHTPPTQFIETDAMGPGPGHPCIQYNQTSASFVTMVTAPRGPGGRYGNKGRVAGSPQAGRMRTGKPSCSANPLSLSFPRHGAEAAAPGIPALRPAARLLPDAAFQG